MKNKFLLIAASTTALSTAILSAPAHAQITGTTPNTVGVSVTVPEVLYLRTVNDIDLNILPSDLIKSPNTISDTTGYGANQTGSLADMSSGVDETSPFNGTASVITVKKTTPANVFAVWSNNPRTLSGSGTGAQVGGVRITVAVSGSGAFTTLPTGATGSTANKIASVSLDPASAVTVLGAAAPGLLTPVKGPVTLNLELAGTQTAGDYSGASITVQAEAP